MVDIHCALHRFMPRQIEFIMTKREMVDCYAEKSGLSFENINYYYCFGLFRLAAIDQQFYCRYYHGQIQDERFAAMITNVRVLERAALRAMRREIL